MGKKRHGWRIMAALPRRRNVSNLAALGVTEQQERPTVRVHSFLDQGCVDYVQGWAWQHVLLSRRLQYKRQQRAGTSSLPETERDSTHVNRDCLLLWEHHPVYTLGRGADEQFLTFLQQKHEQQDLRARLSRKARGPGTARLAMDDRLSLEQADENFQDSVDRLLYHVRQHVRPVLVPHSSNCELQVPIYRVERGGEVTFHGPGQLVAYPIFDLQPASGSISSCFRPDLHWFLRQIEQVVIQTLARYDIVGVRDTINTGVWVDDCKVAALGVTASRWITTHGMALNVHPNLAYFDAEHIVPCGVEGRGVTSIGQILQNRGEAVHNIPKLPEVAAVVVEAMEDVFGVRAQYDHAAIGSTNFGDMQSQL